VYFVVLKLNSNYPIFALLKTRELTKTMQNTFVYKLTLKITLILLLWHGYQQANAQNEGAIRAVIEAGDIKKLKKADEGLAEADRIMVQVREMNSEILAIESNTALDEKSRKKKLHPLQARTQQEHLQASALYKKYHEQKFVIYKGYLDKFWKDHTGDESDYQNAKALYDQSDNDYLEAAGYRIDAKKMNNGSTKMEKLTDANALEIKSINNQLTALTECYAIAAVIREPAEAVSVVSETQQVPPPPVSSVVPPPAAAQTVPPEPAPKEVLQPGPVSQEVSYRVQLIASKIPLTSDQVAKTYKGKEPVLEMQENGWYKYQLDGGKSLKRAQELRQQCGITGAFIVPYRGSVKITFKEAAQLLTSQ